MQLEQVDLDVSQNIADKPELERALGVSKEEIKKNEKELGALQTQITGLKSRFSSVD